MRDHTCSLSVAGLGNVGRALLRRIAGDPELFRAYPIVLLADSSGLLAAPEGFPSTRLLAIAERKAGGGALAEEPGAVRSPEAWESTFAALAPRLQVELGPTDLRSGGSSLERCLAALSAGASVASASKGPFAVGWEGLVRAAGGDEAFTRRCRFSATVGAGTPMIDLGRALSPGTPIRGIAATLNGTSSLVLSLLEAGASLETAVSRAQELGMAEADPSADLDGWDAAAKLCILARAVLGVPIGPEEVLRESVREASPARVARARAAGKRLVALGRLTRQAGGTVAASVRLEEVAPDSPLAAPGGGAAILFDTEYAGEVVLGGRGAGPGETASAVLRDIVLLASAGGLESPRPARHTSRG